MGARYDVTLQVPDNLVPSLLPSVPPWLRVRSRCAGVQAETRFRATPVNWPHWKVPRSKGVRATMTCTGYVLDGSRTPTQHVRCGIAALHGSQQHRHSTGLADQDLVSTCANTCHLRTCILLECWKAVRE